jgi:hypothetical protein
MADNDGSAQDPTQTTTPASDDSTILGDAGAGDSGTGDSGTAGGEPGSQDGGDSSSGDDTVPEAYEFKIEGVEIDQTLVEQVTPLLKELNLTQAQADKLAEFFAGTQKSAEEGGQKAIEDFYAGLRKEAAKIPQADLGLAKKALNHFGEDGKAVIADRYLGNNPALIRLLSRVGRMMSDGQSFEGSQGGGTPDTEQQLETMYPSMKTG